VNGTRPAAGGRFGSHPCPKIVACDKGRDPFNTRSAGVVRRSGDLSKTLTQHKELRELAERGEKSIRGMDSRKAGEGLERERGGIGRLLASSSRHGEK